MTTKFYKRRAELIAELQSAERGRDLAIETYKSILNKADRPSYSEVEDWVDTINALHDEVADIEGEIYQLDLGFIKDKGDFMAKSSRWHY